MGEQNFTVMAATEKDSRAIWEIRFHPEVTSTAIHQERVSFSKHDEWFKKKYFIGAPHACFVIKVDLVVVGYCRFDQDENGDFFISIGVHPDQWRRGLGKKILIESLHLFGDKGNIFAEIKKENETSLRLFEYAGFEIYREDQKYYFLRKHMIKCGLKLWTNNSTNIFKETVNLYRKGQIDFIEIYHNAASPIDYETLLVLKEIPTTVHNTHNLGWHEFDLGETQLKIWQDTLNLANFFKSPSIIVHPGKARNFSHFISNLEKIEDSRIILENMSGLDVDGANTYARTLPELRELKTLKPICFDFEKAIKSAAFQKIDYKNFIDECLVELQPEYFHISGGDQNSSIDEHKNLWEANFDIGWIKNLLVSLSKPVYLVFETPKVDSNLDNDLRNIKFFRNTDHLVV